jgi:hypothetical protein
MKTCGGVEIYFHTFLISALDEDEWSAARPDRFTLGKQLPVPIIKKLNESQNWSRSSEKKNLLTPTRIEPRFHNTAYRP